MCLGLTCRPHLPSCGTAPAGGGLRFQPVPGSALPGAGCRPPACTASEQPPRPSWRGAAAWSSTQSVSVRKLSQRTAWCWKRRAGVSRQPSRRSLCCRAWPGAGTAPQGAGPHEAVRAGGSGLGVLSAAGRAGPRRPLAAAAVEASPGCGRRQRPQEAGSLGKPMSPAAPAPPQSTQQVGRQLLVLGLQRLCLLELEQDL